MFAARACELCGDMVARSECWHAQGAGRGCAGMVLAWGPAEFAASACVLCGGVLACAACCIGDVRLAPFGPVLIVSTSCQESVSDSDMRRVLAGGVLAWCMQCRNTCSATVRSKAL